MPRWPQTTLSTPRWFSKIYANTPCKLTSSTKPITTEKVTLLNLKNSTMSLCYNQKQIIKAVKFFRQTFIGLGPTQLERLHQTTTTWNACSEQINHKSFLECDYDHIGTKYPNLTYKPLPRIRKLTPRSSLNMINCTARPWESHFWMPASDNDKDELSLFNSVKWQSNLIARTLKGVAHQKQQKKFTRKVPLKQTDYMKERIRFTTDEITSDWKRIQSKRTRTL